MHRSGCSDTAILRFDYWDQVSLTAFSSARKPDKESGGGIVALSVGIRQVEIDECLENFKRLAGKAFTKRPLAGTPLLGTLIESYFHSRYKTEPLEKALKEVFGQEPLFGAQASSPQPVSTRVGVTACMESDQTAFLLANYNRMPADCGTFGPQVMDCGRC